MNHSEKLAFLNQTNIYEVNLRQYSREGNIRAFLKHLPRLKDMGVEILWMMPIYPIGTINRKGTLGSYYSIKDFCDINPEFGTKADFKNLVDIVHGYGMKIIIDWVANHAAWDNIWTITNPDFFLSDETGNFISPYDWTDVIQIDHTNKKEQDAMINAMEFWVREFDVDGFRADLAHLTPLAFWKHARKKMEILKPDLIWLAETEEIHYHEAFDISYAWKWMHASEAFFKTDQHISELVELLKKQKADFPADALQLYFTTNHDENSWNGTEYEKYGIYCNALAVFNFTYFNAVPLIYSGQELPNYRRLEFFDKDEIAWETPVELESFYCTLLNFRKNNFADGAVEFLSLGRNILAYRRTMKDKSVLVFLNFEKEKVIFDFTSLECSGVYKNIFSGEDVSFEAEYTIELDAGGFLLLEKN